MVAQGKTLVRGVLASATLLGLALLTVPAHAGSQAATEARTIRVVSVTVASKVTVDKAPRGVRNAGDKVWAKSSLRNARPQFGKPKGALVGSAVAIYTFQSRDVGDWGDLKVTTTLPGGTIRSVDRVSYEGCCATESRVTGGTGVYSGARGTLQSELLTGGGFMGFTLTQGRRLNIYRLQLP
jgi:hypothetical protein